ncbi:MAG: HEAT repeat domain-containing protein [Candidatus Omnitrophica bacterium]|nr:HEAT repeat domain-containing protein [Candidatus Omnitrophota bacterium]
MIKKVIIIVLALCLLLSYKVSFAEDRSRGHTKIKRLISQLYEKPTRLDAQRQLSSYGSEVTEYIIPVLQGRDDPAVRVAALRVTHAIGDRSVEDIVVPMLKDRHSKVRQEAARVLGVVGSKETTIEALKSSIRDSSPNVRYHIVRALSQMPREQETDIFIGVLGDYESKVRKYAVIALGELKSVEAVSSLSRMIRDIDLEVRIEIVNTLAKIGTEECLPSLIWLTGDPDQNVRIKAVKAIGGIESNKTEDALISATDHIDPRIVSAAITELTKRESSKVLDIAKSYVNDEHMVVKVAAIETIGKMGTSSEKPLLSGLLVAESTRVRDKATEALTVIGSGA